MLHTWGEGSLWKKNLHWNIRLNEAHWGSGTVKKQPCDPLFMVLHEAHISFGQPKNERARQRQGEREIKRGKGGEEGASLCLCTPHSAPTLCFCFLFLCMLNAHTHSAMDFQLGPHQLCAWWNKHWQPLYICKGPCSSCACPTHTMHAHKHTLTHNLWIGGLAPAGAYRKSRLCTKWPWLHSAVRSCYSHWHAFTNTHSHSVCHVSLDRTTLPHISSWYLCYYTAPIPQPAATKSQTNGENTPANNTLKQEQREHVHTWVLLNLTLVMQHHRRKKKLTWQFGFSPWFCSQGRLSAKVEHDDCFALFAFIKDSSLFSIMLWLMNFNIMHR